MGKTKFAELEKFAACSGEGMAGSEMLPGTRFSTGVNWICKSTYLSKWVCALVTEL